MKKPKTQQQTCQCGLVHARPNIRLIAEERGYAGMAALLAKTARPVQLVWDADTFEAAGRRVQEDLSDLGVRADSTLLAGQPRLEADDRAVGELLCRLPQGPLSLVSVGSGSLTDITRMVAFRTGLPFYSVASAPSMDGYASSVAPIVVAGIKTTYETRAPLAVSANPAVLAAAPARMKSAGAGDLLGKITARLDWLLSHHLTGEDFCPLIMAGVERPLAALIGRLEQGAGRQSSRPMRFDQPATLDLFSGLFESGLAMARMGNSRPASGAEHHLSHFFEMKYLDGRADHFLHGETVALGTWLMCALYRTVFGMSFAGFKRLAQDFAGRDLSGREKLLSKAFGRVAPEMIGRWRAGRADARPRAFLLGRLEREWDQLTELVRASRVDGERLTWLFTRSGVPFLPADFGFSAADIRQALVAAKEIRPRFSLLGLLDSLGALEGCIRAAL